MATQFQSGEVDQYFFVFDDGYGNRVRMPSTGSYSIAL
jgi:hypothetical protein